VKADIYKTPKCNYSEVFFFRSGIRDIPENNV
jgi:hypothetical protein